MFICIISLFGAIASASPFNSREVNANAKWLVHTDLEQLKTTEIGKYVLSVTNDKELNDLLDSFKKTFNFNPLTDIDGITLYGSGGGQNGVILLRGEFDSKKMIDLLKINKTHKNKAYGNHQIHSWIDTDDENPIRKTDKNKEPTPTYGAIYDSNLILISSREQHLKNALDVLDGKAKSLHNSPLISNLKELPQTDFIMATVDTSGIQDLDPQAMILKKAQMAIFGIGESDGKLTGSLILDTKGTDEAQTLMTIANGMMALAALQTDDTPEIAMLAKAIKININGKQFIATLAVPVTEIIKSIEECMAEDEDNRQNNKKKGEN